MLDSQSLSCLLMPATETPVPLRQEVLLPGPGPGAADRVLSLLAEEAGRQRRDQVPRQAVQGHRRDH